MIQIEVKDTYARMHVRMHVNTKCKLYFLPEVFFLAIQLKCLYFVHFVNPQRWNEAKANTVMLVEGGWSFLS